MIKNYYVYRHRRLDTNEIFYIGISKYKFRSKSKCNRNSYWKNITNKIKYEIEIIAENLDKETACELEIFLIKEYGRYDLGFGLLVNMTDGGDGTENHIKSEKECKHHSEVMKGKYVGKKNPFYGKNHTEETKKYISEIQKEYFTYENGSWDNIKPKKYNSIHNRKSKKVINITTNIIFNSLKEASEYYNISYYTMKSRMIGERKERNELKYLENE